MAKEEKKLKTNTRLEKMKAEISGKEDEIGNKLSISASFSLNGNSFNTYLRYLKEFAPFSLQVSRIV